MFLERHLAIPLSRAAQTEALLVLEGPRGAGKSTLVQRELPKHLHISLDTASDRLAAQRDPAAFLLRLRRPAVIDDAQRAPELIEHIKTQAPPTPVVLVSAIRLKLEERTLELHQPTLAERQRRPALPMEVIGRFAAAQGRHETSLPWATASRGLELDVLAMVQVQEMARFERFIEAVRASSGELLDQQAIARKVDVAHRTVVRWLEVLDTCMLTLTIPPYEHDYGRRQVKRKKLHWLSESASFESQVTSELYRNACHRDTRHEWRYWRDSNGLEVPLLIDGMPILPAEQPSPAQEAALQRWLHLSGTPQAAIIERRSPVGKRRDTRIHRYQLNQI